MGQDNTPLFWDGTADVYRVRLYPRTRGAEVHVPVHLGKDMPQSMSIGHVREVRVRRWRGIRPDGTRQKRARKISRSRRLV